MVAYTTTYSFAKPTVGDDEDVWGGYLNGNFDTIENLLKGTTSLTSLSLSGNITFGDNDKAIFGAGSDLQIYHDGSDSYISDQGTGGLKVLNDSWFYIKNAADNETKAIFKTNAEVELYYDNALKFETTSTGIDVTGTVTADGLTVSGAATFTGQIDASNQNGILLGTSGKVYSYESGSTYDLWLWNTQATNGLVIRTDGSLKFYDTDYRDIWHSGNDGSGSGLDADTVDGIQASRLGPTYEIRNTGNTAQWVKLGNFAAGQTGKSCTINVVSNSGYNASDAQNSQVLIRFKTSNGGSNQSGFYGDVQAYKTGPNASPSIVRVVQVSTTSFDIWCYFGTYTGDGSFYTVHQTDGTWTHSNSTGTPSGTYIDATINTIWHSGNDGTGSTLDADTLDGVEGASYLRSDAADTVTGTITFSGTSSAPFRLYTSNATSSWDAVTFQATTEWGDSNTYGVLGGDSTEGIMMRRPHVVWNSSQAAADIRLGRSGGTSSGAWVNFGVKASNTGFIGYENNNVLTFSNTGVSIPGTLGVTGNVTTSGLVSASSYVSGSTIYGTWFRAYGQSGLYSQSYGQHFYADSDGYYWECDGAIRVRDGYEGTTKLIVGYHDSGGAGFLNGGGSYWFYSNPSNNTHAILGGSLNYNPYNTVSSTRLMFGGGDTNAQANYYIGTNMENYGGNYTKLDLKWATGIRLYADAGYGGTRFYDRNTGSLLLSVGTGNDDVAVTNDLSVGGTLTVNGAAVGGGPTHSATASGAIADGDPCVVNSNGTVSAVASSSVALGATTPASTGAGYMANKHSAVDANGKILVVFQDSSNYLAAVVGEDNNDGTVTWGTKTTLLTNIVSYVQVCYLPDEDAFITVYRNGSVSNRTYAGKITISGTTPSFTQGGYSTAAVIYINACTNLSTNAVNVVCKYNNQIYGLSARLVNGTATIGNLTSLYNVSGVNECGISYDSSLQKSICVVRRTYAYGFVITQDPSTYNLTAGSANNVLSHSEGGSFRFAYAIDGRMNVTSNGNGKALLVYYTNYGNDTWLSQISVSSSALSLDGAREIDTDIAYEAKAVWDTNTETFLLAYEAGSNVEARVCTIGTSSNGFDVTSSTVVAATSTFNANQMTAVFSTVSNRGLFVAGDSGDSANGDYFFYNNAYTSTNLNADNYIGISNGAYADAATATIQVVGSVDDAQSGLTAGKKYYVLTDGSLSQTAGSPSVFAGTSVSATKLIVKG